MCTGCYYRWQWPCKQEHEYKIYKIYDVWSNVWFMKFSHEDGLCIEYLVYWWSFQPWHVLTALEYMQKMYIWTESILNSHITCVGSVENYLDFWYFVQIHKKKSYSKAAFRAC